MGSKGTGLTHQPMGLAAGILPEDVPSGKWFVCTLVMSSLPHGAIWV